MAKQTRAAQSSSSDRRYTRNGGATADWATVDAEIIKSAIVAASMAMGCIRFGYTGDGGAYALGIYGDGPKPYTEYISPREDIEAVLRDLETTFLDIHTELNTKAHKGQ